MASKAEKRNEKIANAIRDLVLKHEVCGDMRIYFNGKAYDFEPNGEVKTLEDIRGSRFFEYANDETVSMSFEGDFYYVMNAYWENAHWKSVKEQFDKLIEKHGMYYEQGHAWNLSLYEN